MGGLDGRIWSWPFESLQDEVVHEAAVVFPVDS